MTAEPRRTELHGQDCPCHAQSPCTDRTVRATLCMGETPVPRSTARTPSYLHLGIAYLAPNACHAPQ
ncbi:MAG: hypothetical protein NZ874_03320 [Fimbriimonadales bacterium]|nr:hypothetical protein [Fimbriimonadales bacterium]